MTIFFALVSAMTLAAGTVIPVAAQTEVPEGPTGPAAAAADIVAGILAYTRWPRAEGPVRLCVAGQSALSIHLADRTLVSGRRVSVSRRTAGSLPGEGCDAVYLAGLPPRELERIGRGAQGAAIVTITDADPACDSGIMACLKLVPGGMSFDLNIDAVSRSNVRIDPRVLVLARRSGGQP